MNPTISGSKVRAPGSGSTNSFAVVVFPEPNAPLSQMIRATGASMPGEFPGMCAQDADGGPPASPRGMQATRRQALSQAWNYFLSSSSAVFSVALGRMMAATFSSTGR